MALPEDVHPAHALDEKADKGLEKAIISPKHGVGSYQTGMTPYARCFTNGNSREEALQGVVGRGIGLSIARYGGENTFLGCGEVRGD